MRNDPELGQMAPDRIAQHGALAHEQLPCLMQHQDALLLLGLGDRLSTGKGFDGLTNQTVERGDHTPMTGA